MIQIIGFDLDDTLFNATDLASQARIGGLYKIQECGLHFNMQKGIEGLFNIVKEYGSNYTNHYDKLLEEMKTNPKAYGMLSSDFSIPRFVAAGIMGYHEIKVNQIKPFDDVIRSLSRLQDLGYKNVIISDGRAVKQYEKLIRLDVLQFFTEIFISEEVGWKKPEKEFYSYCLHEMRVAPSDSIYIGDRMDHDIVPAQEIGMYTILIHRGGKYDPSIGKKESDFRPNYEISTLDEVFPILKTFKKDS
jgi:putative hydrolase of the HAD superfamily